MGYTKHLIYFEKYVSTESGSSFKYMHLFVFLGGDIYLLLIRSLFFKLFGLIPESQSFALQKLKIKEK